MSTYTPVASTVSSNNATSITFSGIPQSYTDLILNISAKHSTTLVNHRIQFNGDTGANYADLRIFGTGSLAYTDSRESATSIMLGEIGTGQFGADIWHICQYTNTSMHKRIIGRSGNISGNAQAGTGEWRSYNAIDSITIFPGSGNFLDGCTFNLYGIASGSSKATGGLVTTDGTYFYHTFNSSSIFTPTQDLTVDYLVVAGGGGGGRSDGSGGGGGGAGGLRSTVTATGGGGSLESTLSLTAQAYTVLVGAGGTGGTSASSPTQGSNSVFSTITSTGGGKGGHRTGGSVFQAAGTGGSGGGGAGEVQMTGAAGTANQGYAGGNGNAAASVPGGGGGGAGAVGGNATSSTGGAGGNGVAVAISGSSVTYAGGGGSGTYQSGTKGLGGSGGGGNGGDTGSGSAPSAGFDGTVNLGGGGGGGSSSSTEINNGGAGGSGIVIVRYAV